MTGTPGTPGTYEAIFPILDDTLTGKTLVAQAVDEGLPELLVRDRCVLDGDPQWRIAGPWLVLHCPVRALDQVRTPPSREYRRAQIAVARAEYPHLSGWELSQLLRLNARQIHDHLTDLEGSPTP